MTTTAPRPQTARPAPPPSPERAGLRALALDVAVPVASYYLARAAGADLLAALVTSSALPLARTLATLVQRRRRRLDGLALVVLAVNAVSLGVSSWSGNPRFMLARAGAVTAVLGVAIVVSVLARRPLMTPGMRPFVTRGQAAREAAFGRLLAVSDRFGQLERRFSLIWAGVFLAECAVRVTIAVTLPVSTVAWLATVLSVACIGAGVLAGGMVAGPMGRMVRAEAARAGG